MPYPSAYVPLYNASARALKAVHPSLRVGGPASANLENIADLLAEVAASGTPLDFVSSHHYPSDPSCSHDGPHSQHAECFSLDVRSNPPPSQRRAPSLPLTHTQPSIAAALLSRLPPPRAHPAAAAERAALPPSC